MIMKKMYGKAVLWRYQELRARRLFTQVEELDERMQKLTHKLENARRDFDYEKAQRVLDKIDAHQQWTGPCPPRRRSPTRSRGERV